MEKLPPNGWDGCMGAEPGVVSEGKYKLTKLNGLS
jgi:hypothetical protein